MRGVLYSVLVWLFTALLSASEVGGSTGKQASYVGSKACSGCHGAIYKSYFKTAMGNASGTVEPGGTGQPVPGFFVHPASGAGYRIESTTDGVYLDYRKTSAVGQISGKRKLDFFIGSAVHARGYIYRDGGFLFQAPICYYASRRAWDMAPGYETQPSIFLGRKIEQPCLDCHASGSAANSMPFSEGAVSCERCHGPASDHIARFSPSHEGAAIGILNPVKLPLLKRDSVCAQCHLTGEARVQKSETSGRSFIAGDKLTDYVVPFIWASPDQSRLKVIGHF